MIQIPEQVKDAPIVRMKNAVQLFKDFNFHVSDGFEAEARKVLNMAQQWQAATDYTLAELGIDVWVQKAVVQAQKVLQLVALRVDHESAKVKGELATARKATDEAFRQAYDVLNDEFHRQRGNRRGSPLVHPSRSPRPRHLVPNPLEPCAEVAERRQGRKLPAGLEPSAQW